MTKHLNFYKEDFTGSAWHEVLQALELSEEDMMYKIRYVANGKWMGKK